MLDLCSYPRLLRGISLVNRARLALKRRSRAVEQAGRHRSGFYEQVWREAAAELDGSVEALGDDILEISIGDLRTKVCRNYTALDDPVTLLVAGHKPLVYRLLQSAELPVPRHCEFTLKALPRAVAFLGEVAGPCVVKPAKDTGAGQGITTGVTQRAHLARAAAAASAFGSELLIEQQVPGHNYRLLYLNGKLLDAVQRRPPGVVGDGHSTVRQLVDQANAERLARGAEASQVVLLYDLEMQRTLASQGLSVRSVPQAGMTVQLKTVINDNAAADNLAAMHLLCEPVIEAGARAVRAIGARLAGVDVITSDPSRPLEQTGGVILEVNTTPGFYYHYRRKGNLCPVALRVLEYLKDSCQSSIEGAPVSLAR